MCVEVAKDTMPVIFQRLKFVLCVSTRSLWSYGVLMAYQQNSCEYCEEIFTPNTSKQIYCSNECRIGMNSLKSEARYYENREEYLVRGWKSSLKSNYGINFDKYIEMLEAQNYRCAICGRHQEELSKKMAVDHSHNNGHIRGLLCGNCNAGIGNLRDSIDLLKKAQKYLEETGE